jgi:PEP-CTERM motif
LDSEEETDLKKTIFGMILALGTLSAAAIPPCGGTRQAPVQETITSMKAYGVTGCISSDKIFSDFQDILVPAGILPISPLWQVNITEPFADVHIIDFVQDNIGNPLKNDTPGVNNVWGIQYVISVDVANFPNKYITNVGVSQNGATAPGGSALIQKYAYDSLDNLVAGPPALSTPGSFVSTSITGVQWLKIKEFITLNNGTTTAFTDRFLQSTVPEPGTYAMMGLGLAALGLIARRKKA